MTVTFPGFQASFENKPDTAKTTAIQSTIEQFPFKINFHRCRAEQEKEERARRAAKRAKKIEERRRSEFVALMQKWKIY